MSHNNLLKTLFVEKIHWYWIEAGLWEYSCDEEYLEEFNKGKNLKYSILITVIPRNRLDPLYFGQNINNFKEVFIEKPLIKKQSVTFLVAAGEICMASMASLSSTSVRSQVCESWAQSPPAWPRSSAKFRPAAWLLPWGKFKCVIYPYSIWIN